MLKITTIETSKDYLVVAEGKLIAPWAPELKTACDQAKTKLNGRKLVLHLPCLTAISPEGEAVLIDLMRAGVSIRSRGVFAKQLLRELAREGRLSQHQPIQAKKEAP